MKFKDLSVGDWFEFLPGFPRLLAGPWQKVSQRSYIWEVDKRFRVCINSVTMPVKKLPGPAKQKK